MNKNNYWEHQQNEGRPEYTKANPDSLSETIWQDERNKQVNELREFLPDLLTELEYIVYVELFDRQRTETSVAKNLNVSQPRIAQIKDSVLHKVKNYLKETQ